VAQAVPPWLWAVCIREDGPPDAITRLVLHTLRTFMNSAGYAFPSQAILAKACFLSEKSVQRALKAVSFQGEQWVSVQWHGLQDKGWKRQAYRCCVPDRINLVKFEQLVDSYLAKEGEIADGPKGPERQGGPRPKPNGKHPKTQPTPGPVPKMVEGPERQSQGPERGSIGPEPQSPRSGTSVPKVPPDVRTKSSLKSSVKLSEKSSYEGQLASEQTDGLRIKTIEKRTKPELTGAARRQAAGKLCKDSGIDAAIRQYRLTREEAEDIMADCRIGHRNVVV
jgi:hypothetical protein